MLEARPTVGWLAEWLVYGNAGRERLHASRLEAAKQATLSDHEYDVVGTAGQGQGELTGYERVQCHDKIATESLAFSWKDSGD